MAPRKTDFQLVSADLIDAVVSYGQWLESRGFRLTPEPFEMEYPSTPVYRGTRSGESHFVSVSSRVNLSDTEDWVTYGKASPKATMHTVVIANGSNISASALTQLRTWGVGVHLITDDSVVPIELCSPRDLSLNIGFPVLKGKLRSKLGHAKDLIDQGNWKEGYEDACVVLETEARVYLKRKVRGSQIRFVNSRGMSVSYTEAQIDRKTLGQLAHVFSDIVSPSQGESQTTQALHRINPNRIQVAHNKYKSGARAKALRDKAGRDIIVIVNTMKFLTGK